MLKKPLGRTDLQISPIVFGGNVFGWTLNEKQSLRILDEVYDRDFTTIDTADSYSHWAPGNSGGESETIIGKWLKQSGKRDKITLITKVGSNPGKEGRNLCKNYILKAAEDSLRRLQKDYIDLYFTHWDDEVTPVEETLEAYQQLTEQGKVRFIGASNISPERLNASLDAADTSALPKYEVLQPEYNLLTKEKFRTHYQPFVEKYDLGVLSYFSLASGFLTGKYRKKEDLKGSRKTMVEPYLNEKGLKILEILDEISAAHGVSNAAAALRWIIQSPYISAPIASATKSAHLESFEEAANLELTPEEMKKLSL